MATIKEGRELKILLKRLVEHDWLMLLYHVRQSMVPLRVCTSLVYLSMKPPGSKTFGLEKFGISVQSHIVAKATKVGWNMTMEVLALALAVIHTTHLELGLQVLKVELPTLTSTKKATEEKMGDEQVKKQYSAMAEFVDLFDLVNPYHSIDPMIPRNPPFRCDSLDRHAIFVGCAAYRPTSR